MVMRLLMALVLVLVSNVVSADLSCGNNTNSGNARCKQIASSNGYPDGRWNIQSKAGYPSSSMSCIGSSSSGAKYELGFFSCTGSCNNGAVPTIANGYSCDVPPDDCTTNLSTMGADLSGSNTDGACGCPSGKEMLGSGTSSVSCADPCVAGEHRDNGVCVANCSAGFAWDAASSSCACDGYVGELNGVLTCIKSTNSQLGGIQANTQDTKDAVTALGAKQDAANTKLDSIQNNTTIINNNTTSINNAAQSTAASSAATASSAASTASSAAAGAASGASTASSTASIATSSSSAASSLNDIADELKDDSVFVMPSGITFPTLTGAKTDANQQLTDIKATFKTAWTTAKTDLMAVVGSLDSGTQQLPTFSYTSDLTGTLEIDFSNYSNVFVLIGNAFLMFATIISFMIVFGRGSNNG